MILLKLSNDKIQTKTNACRTIMNLRFTALRLWFQINESSSESNELMNNEEEIRQIIKGEFSDIINNWLLESMSILKLKRLSSQQVRLFQRGMS